ncbi:uncharacterized protein LOC112039093 isoform X2 [Quercus suber]|uniref:uncharacterized protein LOC112039093 isoform X2 n=1 Tax=Quercus suber TaxID=58331 RepID=UPI000CE1A331|nr:uncharacterized protein LOC112039093 isoform X2 [Quercus suber]
MDHQDHIKLHTPGLEGHGVQVCRKCGWPFPNPHPSAKLRRAHKRICGTIEGYKLVDSEGNPQLNVSDDEHSDDDHKPPSPKVVEPSSIAKDIGGIGERLNRSEDEVFSDAVAEFSDSGTNSGVGEPLKNAQEPATNVEKVAKDDPSINKSLKDGGIAEIIEPPSLSSESGQTGNPEVPESIVNQFRTSPEFEDHVSTFTVSSKASSFSDCIAEESVMHSYDGKNSLSDSNNVKPETLTDASQESEKISASEDVIEFPLASVVQEPEVPESIVNQLRTSPEFEDHVSTFTVSSKASSFSDCIAEESVMHSYDGKNSPSDSNNVKPEILTDASQESEKISASEDVIECPLASVVQEPDTKGTEETKLDRNLMASMVSPSRFAGKSFELLSKSEVTEGKTSDPVPDDTVIQTGEEHDGGSSSKMSQNDLTPEVDSADHVDAAIDTFQLKVDAAHVVKDLASSGDIIGSGNKKEEGNSSLHVLPVRDDSSDRVNDSINASQINVIAAEGIHSANSVYISESCNKKEETNENENVNVLSVPDDTSILDPPAIMVEDFKDNKGVKLHEYASLDSCATIMDKEDANGSASKEQYSSFQPKQLNEGAEVPSSAILVLEDSGDSNGSSVVVVNEALVEEEADLSQVKLTINEKEVPAEAVITDMEENHTVQSHEVPETHDICDDALQVNFPENAMELSSDAVINQATNLVGGDDAGNYAKAMTEKLDGIGDNIGKSVSEENYTKISGKNSESIGNPFESPVCPTIKLPEVDEAGDREKGKIQKYDVDGIESKDESKEHLSMKTKLFSESASSLQESQTVADNTMDGSVKKLPEINGNGVEVKSIGGSTANESYHGGHVNSLQKTSGDDMTKESHPSHLDSESSFQSSAAVDENHAREFGVGASGITSESLEGNGNFVKQQVAASAIDVSVDSSSQADSLEGHWGSVSVLSTQSDAAVVIDAEALPSSESQASAKAEKGNLEKPREAAEEQQHSEKSDMFEAPSFMTLVESRDGFDQKAAASEIQMGQNSQQQSASLQAGWFPSLTHVVNESQGRKKNEEIIAKVTNWSTGKQHTPLKTLLGEASLETKSKSPRPKENPAPAIQKDETVPKDNGAFATTVNTILGPESPTNEAAKSQAKKEWNSPARYPSEIKREKRKVKGRPYWVQFVCCSSMN